MINVEIVYALPNRQVISKQAIEAGSTALDVILQSGILQEFPDIQLDNTNIGVFGKIISLDYPVQPNDRLEIYRPLLIDPKRARLVRASKAKTSPNL